MAKKTVRDIRVKGKTVLVRVDFNVPLDMKTGAITDDSRIRGALPTIRYLVNHGAKVVLCSHLGRPDGNVVEELRMVPVAQRLSQLMGLPVSIVSDSIGAQVEKAIDKLNNGEILLLENIRFHSEEAANNPSFAQALAKPADLYVDDAFGTTHRAHASTVGVAKYLPAVAGFLMEKELATLSSILTNPEHPFAALLGGAKVSDKISLIQNISDKVDVLLIGGGMAATFLQVQGYEVGLSLIEADKQDLARQLLQVVEQNGASLLLPIDVIVSDSISEQATGEIAPVAAIPPDKYIADIGPQTVDLFSQEIRQCRTVFWNGPMGVYEIPRFAQGTRALVELLADLKATTVIGGGSTAEIVEEMNLTHKMTHVSTGGGASLKFLEGENLPGVAALLDKEP